MCQRRERNPLPIFTIDIQGSLSLGSIQSSPVNESGLTYWDHGGWDAGSRPRGGIALLAAAAYFNNFAMVRTLIAEGHFPAVHGYILPSAMETATFAGNREMLILLQDYLLATDDDWENNPVDWLLPRKDALHAAVLRGDLDMVKLALYPPSRRDANNPEKCSVRSSGLLYTMCTTTPLT